MFNKNLTKIAEFSCGNVNYVFIGKGKWTLCWSQYFEGDTVYTSFGLSMCSPVDSYNKEIGCIRALSDLMDNLHAIREDRLDVFNAFIDGVKWQ